MAKSWKICSVINYKEGWSCYDVLGEIDYMNFDNKYIKKTKDAIEWRKKVITDGKSWNLLDNNLLEQKIFPNMSNNNDAPYSGIKKIIATNVNEITSIWQVTIKNRKLAHSKGIMSWKDLNCNSITLGINGEIRPNIIDQILETNRSEFKIVEPKKIKNNIHFWKKCSNLDFFIDFETINIELYGNNLNINNSKNISDLVFMIGVGHIKNNIFIYKSFCCENLTLDDEFKIFSDFHNYIINEINILDNNLKNIPKFFHWSCAELTNIKHINNRHNNNFDYFLNEDKFIWIDMYKIFISEPITVKGSLTFKLKDICNAMYKLGLIQSYWKDDGPNNGFSAMLSAIEYYKQKNESILKSIIDYNHTDCKVLWEIIEYLRQK
jgi:hypothetical protein